MRVPRATGAPATWTTVEDVQATQYTVTSLTPGATYVYQAQSVDEDGYTSNWSSSATVTLPTAVAISELSASDSQRAANDQIFDLVGRRINASCFKSQSPGVYIRNGKVMIKK